MKTPNFSSTFFFCITFCLLSFSCSETEESVTTNEEPATKEQLIKVLSSDKDLQNLYVEIFTKIPAGPARKDRLKSYVDEVLIVKYPKLKDLSAIDFDETIIYAGKSIYDAFDLASTDISKQKSNECTCRSGCHFCCVITSISEQDLCVRIFCSRTGITCAF